jgi:flagellar hook-associated protein 3 FlgL
MLSPISAAGERFLSSVNDVHDRLERSQREISSGQKIGSAADAPDQISPILQLRAEIQGNLDIQAGLETAKSDLDAGEGALSNSVELLESASVIATQGMSFTQTAATRSTLAKTVEGLLEQMVLNSRTSLNGRYIFSGDSDRAPLFQFNPGSAAGVDRLGTSAATRLVNGPGGAEMQAGLSANDIFDRRNADGTPASGNAFDALNRLRIALRDNDVAGIEAALPALSEASDYLNGQLAFYGRAQNRVASWIEESKSRDVGLRAQLSGKTDADLTRAITELTEGQTQLQATLSVEARMPRTSLFDLLQG